MTKKRVSDYIADFLASKGVDTAFQVSGGGMMFLLDSIGRHEKIKVVANHHEQASAMSALTYAKMKNTIGACYVTTGCGVTNTITGLLNAWQDNIPCFFFSGQSKTTQTVANSGLKLKQIGVQEAHIIPVVEPLSKYAVMINDPKEVMYHLEKAYELATTGRPGPVWIDVPLDVQGAFVAKKDLKKFNKKELKAAPKLTTQAKKMLKLENLLKNAKRPVILAGQGIRLSNTLPEFRKFLKATKIPFIGTYLAVDYVPYDDPSFIGAIGVKGTRPGNFAMQNADLVVVLGSRLSVSATGYDFDQFAREAKVVVVDIDAVEHKKPGVKIDLFINADLQDFFKSFKFKQKLEIKDWLKICASWKELYPVCEERYAKSRLVNQYQFMDVLCKNMADNGVVISDAGSAYYVASQAVKVRGKQRYITSGAQAEMGYTVPAVIGAAYGDSKAQVVGVTGEGSFQMNIQELQTIVHDKIPVKIFVWNNGGYLSIKATQNKFFNGFFVGVDESSGISFPDLKKISAAYKIPFVRIKNTKELESGIKKVLKKSGPVLCEVMCDKNQEVIPTLSSYKNDEGVIVSRPMEDLYPFLPREEFEQNMIVKPIKE